jgi:hypothetical protein
MEKIYLFIMRIDNEINKIFINNEIYITKYCSKLSSSNTGCSYSNIKIPKNNISKLENKVIRNKNQRML